MSARCRRAASPACAPARRSCGRRRPSASGGTYENPQAFNWGIVILYSIETAEPLALLHEFELSGMRVGATSAVAVDAMARDDARTLALFGTGKQAHTALEAIALVRPIDRINVFSPSAEHRAAFAREMSRDGLAVVAAADPRAAIEGADIVCCATAAMHPVFDGDRLRGDELVVSIANSDVTNKRHEVDRRTYERARCVVINDWESVIDNDQTELLDPIADGIVARDHVHELGALLAGDISIRQPPRGAAGDQVIYYKNNSGLAIQFAAAGGVLVPQGAGRRLQQGDPDRVARQRPLGLLQGRLPAVAVRTLRMRSLRLLLLAARLPLLAAVALPLLIKPAAADDVADFYRGKRLSLVIGFGAGGGYDLYARMLGRFIGAHIPGNPTIVPQNMPGAGSRNAANWLYAVAPRDGSVIATLGQATPTDQALGQPGVLFDARRFNWIGNLALVNNILFVSAASGVATFADAKLKPVAVGASGASSPSVLYPQVSNNLLGSKFKIVSGYPGGGDINIAVERHEVDGRGSDSWASMKSTHPDWVRDHAINILFQVGPRREPDLPDVPLWTELAGDADQRQVLEILSGDVSVGRPILTAPEVPAARVKALRQAFDDTLRDPNFLEAARGANMDFNPMDGEQLQQIVGRIVAPSPRILALVKDAIAIKDLTPKK